MTPEEIIKRLLPHLPDEGQQSKRAFALWCAERVKHLNTDPRIEECLAVVRRKVADPTSVTNEDLKRAGDAIYYAARNVAYARAVAYYAASYATVVTDITYYAVAVANAAANAAATAAAYADNAASRNAAYGIERKAQVDWLVKTVSEHLEIRNYNPWMTQEEFLLEALEDRK